MLQHPQNLVKHKNHQVGVDALLIYAATTATLHYRTAAVYAVPVSSGASATDGLQIGRRTGPGRPCAADTTNGTICSNAAHIVSTITLVGCRGVKPSLLKAEPCCSGSRCYSGPDMSIF